MPEYLSPGVYVEEVDAGPKPIEGVSTSTTGAVGITLRGPTSGKPLLVTSFADFTRQFGGFVPEPDDPSLVNKWALDRDEGGRWWYFPLAVKGFFDNGGQRIYVKRVFSSQASAADATLGQGVDSPLTDDASATDTSVTLEHLIGLQVGSAVKVFASGRAIQDSANPPKDVMFNVAAYDAAGRTVTFDKAVGQELKAGRDWVEVSKRQTAAAGTGVLTFSANALGDWGNTISVRISPMVGGVCRILPDPILGGLAARTTLTADSKYAATLTADAAEPSTVLTAAAANTDTVTVKDTTGFNVGDAVQVGAKKFKILAVDPVAKTIQLDQGANTWPVNTAAQRLFDAASSSDLAVDDSSVFQVNDTFQFKGAQYTVKAVPSKTAITINPPIPDGKTWAQGTELDNPSVHLAVDDSTGFAKNDHALIAGSEYVVSAVPDNRTITVPAPADGSIWPKGQPAQRLRKANQVAAPSKKIHVSNATQLYVKAQVELDNGTKREFTTVDAINGNEITLGAALANQYYEGQKLRLIEADVRVQYAPDGKVDTAEHFTNLRLTDDGSNSYLGKFLALQSALITADTGGNPLDLALASFPNAAIANPESLWSPLTGGDDSNATLSVDDFVGVDGGSGNRTGIQALEDIDEIAICVVPQMWSATVQSNLILHCETLRYRFAIIDPQDGLSIQGIQDVRADLDSKYAAIYYPWIEVRDPSIKRNVTVAPSAHLAGIYARVDVDRGVHKAPANEVIQSITKIAQDVNKREQDVLNPVGINALRAFTNRGNRVWGARTISSDSSWKYINVRRLFIFVEHSIDLGTQWVVFEPNDEPLWARVRQSVGNFLNTVWRSGALQGAKPDDAYFVKCDHTTMTQDDIDNGRLICLIGIAPVKPAEFVIFRVQQKTLDTKTS